VVNLGSPSRKVCARIEGGAIHRCNSVVANNFFPCIYEESTIKARRATSWDPIGRQGQVPLSGIQLSCAPFTRTLNVDGVQVSSLTCVAYYEVTLRGERSPSVPVPGISVGLANPLFPLRDRLPGLDDSSIGYYSRDGMLYKNKEGRGEQCGPPFSHGDTIGCGIVYPPLCESTTKHRLAGYIFFTCNGQKTGQSPLPPSRLGVPWFPVVGLEQPYEIKFNFGDESFKFNVSEFEYELYDRQQRAPTSKVVVGGKRKRGPSSSSDKEVQIIDLQDCYYEMCMEQVQKSSSVLAIHPMYLDPYGTGMRTSGKIKSGQQEKNISLFLDEEIRAANLREMEMTRQITYWDEKVMHSRWEHSDSSKSTGNNKQQQKATVPRKLTASPPRYSSLGSEHDESKYYNNKYPQQFSAYPYQNNGYQSHNHYFDYHQQEYYHQQFQQGPQSYQYDHHHQQHYHHNRHQQHQHQQWHQQKEHHEHLHSHTPTPTATPTHLPPDGSMASVQTTLATTAGSRSSTPGSHLRFDLADDDCDYDYDANDLDLNGDPGRDAAPSEHQLSREDAASPASNEGVVEDVGHGGIETDSDEEDEDDDYQRSIATSLLVEVDSVDDKGSYTGYCGKIDEDYYDDDDDDDRFADDLLSGSYEADIDARGGSRKSRAMRKRRKRLKKNQTGRRWVDGDGYDAASEMGTLNDGGSVTAGDIGDDGSHSWAGSVQGFNSPIGLRRGSLGPRDDLSVNSSNTRPPFGSDTGSVP